jgi:hypothetical protein
VRWFRHAPIQSNNQRPVGDFGFWILDFGFWILDFGFWILVMLFKSGFLCGRAAPVHPPILTRRVTEF